MKSFPKLKDHHKILLLVLYFPLSILCIEILAHLNIVSGLLLVLKNPFAFLMNTMLFAGIAYFLLSLMNRQKLVFSLMTLVSFFIGLGTKLKIDFRGVGLNILDLLTLKEAGEMTNNLTPAFLIQAGMMVLLFSALFFFVIRNAAVVRLNPKFRKNGILVFLLICLFLYFLGPYTVTVKSAGIKRKLYIEESGSLYYFAAQIRNTSTLKTPTKEQVDAAFSGILAGLPAKEDAVKPDIIVIQSESFTDPTLIGMENFSEDPLPYFHSLQQSANSFNISVPSFCGGTANSEFEVVTGMSTIFYPSDATVYANYMTKPSVSIGSILRKDGYTSTLLHPFHSTFYSRDNAYKLLGFDKFYGLEYLSNTKAVTTDTRYWDAISEYMSDSMLYGDVLKELDGGSGNQFVMAVTMQNHTPFAVPKGFEESVSYTGGRITSEVTLAKYNTYLTNLKASDEALRDFIAALSERDRPTILLFYGDHYPKINQDGNAYASIGLVTDLTSPLNDYLTHQTPAFIWSNYKDVGKTDHVVDASLVSAKLLALTGVEVPNYMKVNSYLEGLGVNSMSNAYLVMGNQFYEPGTEVYKRIYDLYSILNGDIQGDNKYLETREWIIKDNAGYINPK